MTALWKPKLNVTFLILKPAPQRLSHHILTYIIIVPSDIWISLVDFQVVACSPILHFPTQSGCSFFAPTKAIPNAPLATASSILASLISWKGRRPHSPLPPFSPSSLPPLPHNCTFQMAPRSHGGLHPLLLLPTLLMDSPSQPLHSFLVADDVRNSF